MRVCARCVGGLIGGGMAVRVFALLAWLDVLLSVSTPQQF